MPTERSDKALREKISELDSLPAGFQLNSSARWHDIEEALHPAKKKNISWRYAAVILLCFCTIPLLWKSYRQQPVIAGIKTRLQPLPPVPSATQAIAKQYPLTPIAHSSAHFKAPVIAVSVKNAGQTDSVLLQNTGAIAETPAVISLVPDPVIIPVAKPVLLSAVTKKPVIQTKHLRVVHINELGMEQEILFTHLPSKRSQVIDETSDESIAPQNNRPWWQVRAKTITTVTLSDHP